MRRDSIIIAVVSVIIAAAIAGSGYYLNAVYTRAMPATKKETTWTTLKPHSDQATGGATTVADVPAETSQNGNSTIIKCTDPEVGEFWTNAATCEDADLNNRLTYAQTVPGKPAQEQYSGQDYVPPAQQAANSRIEPKPNLRLHGKAPPPGLNVSCKFSVGKALEIERDLSPAENPQESIWKKDYCHWRCEALKEKCPVSDSYYYYRYAEFCRQEYLKGC